MKTATMKTNKTTGTSGKNKRWMRNPDQLKTPKIFSLKVLRNPNGTFHVIGGNTKLLKRINQHVSEWVSVDTRDFACELNNSSILAL